MTKNNKKAKNTFNKMIHCHYVPQFILRNYGSTIDVFNVRTQQYLQSKDPNDVFFVPDLYPSWLEVKFNKQMEDQESKRLVKKILTKKGDIHLTRDDVQHFKRFFLIGMIRCPESLNYIHKFRKRFYSEGPLCTLFKNSIGDRFKDDNREGESDYDYWIRTLDTILDIHDFNPASIIDNPKST